MNEIDLINARIELYENPENAIKEASDRAKAAYEKEKNSYEQIDGSRFKQIWEDTFRCRMGLSESPTKHEETFNWELPKSMFRVSRVAFNKCKTSRKRKGLAEQLAVYQDLYRRYCGEIKTTNKKHHGFVMGHPVNGGLLVICDDAKIRLANGNDLVYL